MKPAAILLLSLAFATVACAHEPTGVHEALTLERLRADDPAASPAAKIEQATERYAAYFKLARTRQEVRAVDEALHRYCREVLKAARRQHDAAKKRFEWLREHERRERLEQLPIGRA